MPAQASDEKVDINYAEHQLYIAGSYGLTLTTYSVLGETTELSQGNKLFISAASTIALGFAVDSLAKAKSGHFKENVIGAAGAVVVPLVFNF